MSNTPRESENSPQNREKARSTLLIGYDENALQTAYHRLYVLESSYREDMGISHVPAWITENRLLIEEILGENAGYNE